MTIQTAAALAWAKSDPIENPHLATHYLPLAQHLDDAGGVMGFLWDEWLSPSVRRLISAGLPDGDADGKRLVTYLAGIHDIGKISPAFAMQVPVLCDRMVRDGGYPPVGSMVRADRSRHRHELAGAFALRDWLQEKSFDEEPIEAFCAVVIGHHGEFRGRELASNESPRSDLHGTGVWEQTRTHLLDRAAERFGVMDRLSAWRSVAPARPVQMAITGLVVMADWIASSSDYFPLLDIGDVPDLPDADHDDSARLDAGLRRLDLSPPWRPGRVTDGAGALFHERFPEISGTPRPVQEAVVEAARTMPAPGLMIVEAPMGEGKTEAGFLAAETLAARAGASGILVALPTQATSDAMFTRLRDFLERLPGDEGARASLALVHGKAALNDDYRDIRYPRAAVTGEDDPARTRPQDDSSRLLAVVDEWMTGRKRAGLSSFVVGTIDQVLFSALRARHVMLRQLSLIGKVVVLDEVHAADVYMSEFLDRALEWLGASGTPVVLMSATLPPARRAALYEAYEKGRLSLAGSLVARRSRSAEAKRRSETLDTRLGYPSVVTTGEGMPMVRELAPSGRATAVGLRRLGDDLPTLVDLLRTELDDGGCAVVIRNTVTRVQETARALREAFPGDEVSVAHAQFLASDRRENDARLLDLFGKPGGASRPERHIVVASQVVEQSLDIDFDLMVTDVAPVDLVLQRLGRLHRHRRGAGESERPARLREARCWITGVDEGPVPPKLDGGTEAVYGRAPVLAALAVLSPHLDGLPLRLPEDIAPLVADAYGDPSVSPDWEPRWSQARRRHEIEADERRGAAHAYLLGEPGGGGGSLLGASTAGLGIVDEDSPRGQACVRDGGDSIEVVVVSQFGQNDYRVPSWVSELPGETLPPAHEPVDPVVARALARCTLRLPFRLCVGGTFDKTLADLERNYFEGWRWTPFLSGMLALVLDEQDSAVLSQVGCKIRYSRADGLAIGRDEEVG